MNFEIVPVAYDEKAVLANLMEKYDYEFSQYDDRDVNNFGLYGYLYLDNYWTEDRRHAFFIKADNKLAGFVMVSNRDETGVNKIYAISEFFVMYKYRRSGIGRYAAYKMFDMFKGDWEFCYHPKNIISRHFWRNIVSDYTNGNFEVIESDPNEPYDDGSFGDTLKFKS